MKKRIYLRIGDGTRSWKVHASTKPQLTPLRKNSYTNEYVPTVCVALDLEIPDSEFSASRLLLEAKIEKTIPALNIEQAGHPEKELMSDEDSN